MRHERLPLWKLKEFDRQRNLDVFDPHVRTHWSLHERCGPGTFEQWQTVEGLRIFLAHGVLSSDWRGKNQVPSTVAENYCVFNHFSVALALLCRLTCEGRISLDASRSIKPCVPVKIRFVELEGVLQARIEALLSEYGPLIRALISALVH